jgi:two-component system chemotaxis response regulator CheY
MKSCLIVDDAMIMRMRLQQILENDFNIVGMASNGQEALEQYGKLNPDFITLDISMPEKNGIQVLTEIMEKFPNANVIIVSAVGQKQMIFDALGLGAKDFVVKPFEPEKVLAAAKRLFA